MKFDHIEGIDKVYIQIQGKDREAVGVAGRKLGLEGSYIAHSYIELVSWPAVPAPWAAWPRGRIVSRIVSCGATALESILLADP